MALRTNNITYILQFSFFFHQLEIFYPEWGYMYTTVLITKIKEFNIIKFLSKVLLNRSERRESSVVKHKNPESAKFRNVIFQ